MTSDPLPTALLIMDMQSSILRNFPDAPGLLGLVEEALAFARKQNFPILFVTVGFREGAPEISSDNKGFSAGRERFLGGHPEVFLSIHPALSPRSTEIIVVKRRVSAFTGSDLEVCLRSLGVRQLVLCGYATSGVVLSTVREAADMDYRILVLSDGCADPDPEVHDLLLTKIFPRQAEVLTVGQWCQV